MNFRIADFIIAFVFDFIRVYPRPSAVQFFDFD